MKKKTYSVKDVKKMVKTTIKKNDWNNGIFARYAELTQPRLSEFMSEENDSVVPSKLLKVFGLQKVVTVKYINEGE